MAQRSPYNDRYKVDQKGKTRRSASAAKPKRDLADLTPANSGKVAAPVKKKGFFGAARASQPSRPVAPMLSSPRLKQLRQIWWILWVVALGVAIGILYLQQAGPSMALFVPFGWAVWAGAMGGAFYLEFVPIRKERARLMDESKKGGKSSKKDKGRDKTELPALDVTEPPASDDSEPPAATPITSA